jgi:hypothetical protein
MYLNSKAKAERQIDSAFHSKAADLLSRFLTFINKSGKAGLFHHQFTHHLEYYYVLWIKPIMYRIAAIIFAIFCLALIWSEFTPVWRAIFENNTALEGGKKFSIFYLVFMGINQLKVPFLLEVIIND